MDGVINIKKGLQKEVLFYNLKAKYINYFLIIGIIILLVGIMISMVTNMIVAGIFIITALIVSFSVLFFYSKTYGENGFIKNISNKKKPNGVTFNTSFKNIVIWKRK